MPRVLLMGCGCFNPPTIMHLRMFDVAKDHLESLRSNEHRVLGGIISPTHDAYPKAGLLPSHHRLQMAKLSTSDSELVRLSPWECEQEQWTPTRQVLEHHRDEMLKYANDGDGSTPRPEWLPDSAGREDLRGARIYFLCGDDLLESFNVKGLWAQEDIVAIVRDFGLVVLSRGGTKPQELVYKSDALNRYKENIYFALSDMGTDISSTKVRLALRRGRSVQYLVRDAVVRYIRDQGLYAAP